jgi:transcription initiation factor IIE alpha subunit
MKVECPECNYMFDHYNNMYGTVCPKCDSVIKPYGSPSFLEENGKKINKLRKEFLNKLRNNKE